MSAFPELVSERPPLAVVAAVRAHAPRLTARCTDAALAGLLLLVAMGVIITSTIHFQGLDAHRPAAIAIAVGMWSLKPVVLLLPWRRWHPLAPLTIPALAMTALAALSVVGNGVGAAYVGIYVLCFVYTGLLLPRRSSYVLLVPAVATFGPLIGGWSHPVLVRCAVSAMVWVLVGELLAHLAAQQHKAMLALQVANRRDPMTQLGNRRGLDLRLERLAEGDCLVIADLDHFKAVNDARGHAGGDGVLVDFADMLSRELRGSDYAARYGGEEFVLLLPGTDASSAAEVLVRLHQRWAQSHPDITFSTGVAVHRGDVEVAATMQAADAALYLAKASGRDRDRFAARSATRAAATAPVAITVESW